MKNIHNINPSKKSFKEAIKTSLFYKDQHGRFRKKTNDYSGLQAHISSELYVDGWVAKDKKSAE